MPCASARAALALFSSATSVAFGQQLIYSGNLIVPLIAETPSYQSAIYVHNPSTSASTVNFTYTGATGSASPGTFTCPSLAVPAGTVVTTSLTALCPALNAGSNFGALTMTCCSYAAIYTRVQTPGGNGFSVEGILDGNFCCSGYVRESIGLKRQAASPTFQTNCFIMNQDPTRSGRLVVTLLTGNGQLIADDIFTLQPGEFVRLLDVFATLGVPAGDYANSRATFESIIPLGGGSPVNFVAACTVQNNTSFDADFRIAKFHN